jgi:hypothetical protein
MDDGAGGAFVAWYDSARTATYAQHVDSTGALLWGAGGVPLHTDASAYSFPALTHDGGSGFFAEMSVGGVFRLQHIDASGNRLLGNGVTVGVPGSTLVWDMGNPANIVSTPGGGCVVTWAVSSTGRLFAQGFSAAGAPAWGASGVELAPGAANQFHVVCGDGAGGVFLAYAIQDASAPGNYGIRAQHLSAAGAAAWGAGGLQVFAPQAGYAVPVLAPDGAGGVFVGDEGWNTQLARAQRISAAGSPQWGASGVTLSSTLFAYFSLLADGAGGATAVWADSVSPTRNVIRAQHLDAAGAATWSSAGRVVDATVDAGVPRVVASPGFGTLLVSTTTTVGSVAGTSADILARLLRTDGTLGDPVTRIAAVRDVPADQGGRVAVVWPASPLESRLVLPVTQYRLWQRDDTQPGHPYVVVATAAACGLEGYGTVAATTADSAAGALPYAVFELECMTASGSSFSPPDSGYSVDNLPPYPPSPLPTIAGPFGVRLHWLPSEGATHYRLYRSTGPAFSLANSNLVATLTDTAWVDPAGAGASFAVAAVDAHGNASAAAMLPAATTDANASQAPREPALFAPVPSPVRSGDVSTLRFALPEAGPVTLALHDLSGRRVRVIAEGRYAAGTYVLRACGPGSNPLPAGLYFVRMTTRGRALERRLVVTR